MLGEAKMRERRSLFIHDRGLGGLFNHDAYLDHVIRLAGCGLVCVGDPDIESVCTEETPLEHVHAIESCRCWWMESPIRKWELRRREKERGDVMFSTTLSSSRD